MFAQIAGTLAACLRGRVLAAFNLPFDRRSQRFDRAYNVPSERVIAYRC